MILARTVDYPVEPIAVYLEHLIVTSQSPSQGSAGKAVFFIAIGMFGLYAIEFGVVGILSSIMDRYQVSIIEAGWLVGFFALVIAICGPFMVIGLARYDRRKVLVAALAVFAICSALSAFAPSFLALIAIRIPAALLHAVFFSVAFTSVRAMYPPERAAHAIALVFVGTSVGLVLGVPITAWIEARISYEGAFFFIALANLVAAIGVWFMVPSSPAKSKADSKLPFGVLRQRPLLLAIAQGICVFGAMFSVYSFAAEYLRLEGSFDGEAISALLVVFGIGGILGNLFAGRMLGRNLFKTVLFYPIVLSLSYLVLVAFGGADFAIMLGICFVWGAAHTAGMVVSQVWTTSSVSDSPEFVTSLFVSAGNLGVMIGSAVGGVFITWFGVSGAIWSGWIFAVAASGLAVLSRTGRETDAQRSGRTASAH
ncbi:MFS transporter (plasmid) [Agrobacterium sp. rho-13.3]|uniref:MFS transporter n=1 Tax=Agrobacterium sp. rho-13.3 TaxID=3072980 RepID=UPI002A23B1F3|nr:MFS transporter [Agrobacterium sp. rho-13.3]